MTGRVKTYEAIVKGHNVPNPGVPESFKVLVKELQSLCLDVRVLDENGDEIILRDEDEDDMVYAAGLGDETYVTDEGEVFDSGFALDEDQPDENVIDVISEMVSSPDLDDEEEM